MNKAIYPILLALTLGMLSSAAQAAKPVVGGCGKMAGERRGEERNKFMKECATAQRKEHDQKLKMCRAKAASEPSKTKYLKMINECMES